MGYLTALAKTDLTGYLDYSEQTIVEKLYQTYTMRAERFHEPGTVVSQRSELD